jgi:hypothetical protein
LRLLWQARSPHGHLGQTVLTKKRGGASAAEAPPFFPSYLYGKSFPSFFQVTFVEKASPLFSQVTFMEKASLLFPKMNL